jgi:hypothetical protein
MRTCTTSRAKATDSCPDQTLFPQRSHDTRPFPWHTLFDSTALNLFPIIKQVVDSLSYDFNNDGRMEVSARRCVVAHRPSYRTDRMGSAQLANGTKGFTFNSSGVITVNRIEQGERRNICGLGQGKDWLVANTPRRCRLPRPLRSSVAGMPPLPVTMPTCRRADRL